MVTLFRRIRICLIGMVAGFIGMLAGLAGEIYIYEFSDRSLELVQAAVVFGELDAVSFLVCYFFMLLFLVLCVSLEAKRFRRRYRKRRMALFLTGIYDHL